LVTSRWMHNCVSTSVRVRELGLASFDMRGWLQSRFRMSVSLANVARLCFVVQRDNVHNVNDSTWQRSLRRAGIIWGMTWKWNIVGKGGLTGAGALLVVRF
jgi:predicted MarR family transcription regulator